MSGPQIIVPRIGETLRVGEFLRDSSKMVSGTVIDLTTKTSAKSLLSSTEVMGTMLFTKEKGLVIQNAKEATKLRIPELVKQRSVVRSAMMERPIAETPKPRPIMPIMVAWLDPAQRKKKAALLKKKKK